MFFCASPTRVAEIIHYAVMRRAGHAPTSKLATQNGTAVNDFMFHMGI